MSKTVGEFHAAFMEDDPDYPGRTSGPEGRMILARLFKGLKAAAPSDAAEDFAQ